MKRILLVGMIWASCCCYSAADVVTAASGTVDGFSDGGFIDPVLGGGANSAFFAEVPLTGVPLFDPTVGALDEVQITFSFDFELNAEIEVLPIEPDETFEGSASVQAEVGLFLFSESGTSISAIISEFVVADAFCFGDGNAGDTDCFEFAGGSANAFESLTSVGGSDLAAFIGSGDVSRLSVGFFFPVEADATLDNAEITISGDAVMENISYQIDYVFTPAAIPEPACALLLGLAASLLGVRRVRFAFVQ